jgi:hypothetical protein
MSIPKRTSNPRKTIIIYEMTVWSFFKGLLKKYRGNRVYYNEMSYLLKTILGSPLVKKVIKTEFEKYIPPKYISEYEGSLFLIENLNVELTKSFFSDRKIAEKRLVRAYKSRYRTSRIDTVIKYFIQDRMRKFLRFYYQVRCSGEDVCIIVPEEGLYHYILGKDPFSNLKPVGLAYLGLRLFSVLRMFRLFSGYLLEILFSLFRQRYTLSRVTKKDYKVCLRAHNPKSEGILRNDFLIDGKEISPEKVLFFIENTETEYGKTMTEYYRRGKYHYIGLNALRIPLKKLPGMIGDYILLPLKAFILYLWKREDASLNALLTFSRMALKTMYETIFYNYNIGIFLLYHSAGSEMLIGPALCSRHGIKSGIYNFGVTASWFRWSPYSFQIADYYFAWGENVLSLYSPTCELGEVIKTGFWGKGEYLKICSRREDLKREIIGENNHNQVVTFYDIPYFHERSTFTARNLLDFYNMALTCSMLDGVTVIIKMKSRYNINGARYPDDIKPLFEKLWKEIREIKNIIILDTSMYDPLHVIAISDINITLELTTPSTVALICGEAGYFYNVIYDYTSHPLYPKYFGRLIFNDTERLVDTIRRHLKKEIDLKNVVEDGDLKGYDEYRDNNGLTRFRQAIRELTDQDEKVLT